MGPDDSTLGVVTLGQLPEAAASRFPQMGYHLLLEPERWSVEKLCSASSQVSARLEDLGVRPGDLVGVALPTSLSTLATFFGVFRAGATLVPLPVTAGLRNAAVALERLRQVLHAGGVRWLVVPPEQMADAGGASPGVRLLTPSELLAGRPDARPARGESGDLAIVQYTSGSTSKPRGAALTHGQVIAGIRAIVDGAQLTAKDVIASWLPLSHDMGLVGLLACTAAGADQHFSTPSAFFRRPGPWLRAFAAARATLYAGPNFSYRTLLDSLDDPELLGLDLSSWRLAFNGSEQIDPQLVERFRDRFSRAGHRREVMFPVYGLAEATLAVTFPAPGSPPVIEWVDGTTLSSRGIAVSVVRDHPRARGVVSVGGPVPGLELRIATGGQALPDRQVGEIQVRGDSVMSGYFQAPEQTALVFQPGGWLCTGDLGFVAAGRLFVTGRSKELLKVNGDNYFPEDVEALVRQLPGVEGQPCAAVTLPGEAERLALLVETEISDPAGLQALGRAAREAIGAKLGIEALDVYLLPPRTIARTTSGKIQRLAMRERIRAGELRELALGVF